MAQVVEVPFATQTGAAGVTQNSQETLRNMYAEMVTSGRAKLVRRQRPGLNTVNALLEEKRCVALNGTTHYLIVLDTVYSFDGTTLTTLGTIASNSGLCTMVFNDNGEILISDNANLYWWNGTTIALTTVPIGFVPGPLAYLGGFGVVNDTSTNGRFYTTAANDFSNIDALDFATAESAPDPLYRVFADHNELWLAGSQTIEIWPLTGGTDFPFQASTSAKMEQGIGAKMSMAGVDNTLLWLGNDWLVYKADGYRPTVASSNGIAGKIDLIPKAVRAAAYGFVYTHQLLKFYVLTFPGYGSFVLNLATGLWSEANTYGSAEWRVVGGHRVTGYVLTEAGISELTAGLSTDDGGVMVRMAISAPGWANGHRITVQSLLLDCQVGRAAINVDANVMLRVALDGETFGNEKVRSLGPIGAYDRRTVWRGLGQGRKPVLELSMSDPVEFTIMSALAELEVDE